MRQGPLLLLLLAAVYTALDAARPLLVDDAAYECFARHISTHPLDPYGFAMFWYDRPEPANEVLAPPVLLYYWAGVRRLVGERPWLWKLALLPWSLLLVTALHGLLRRFARGQEWPFTVALALSPALLPSLNLMLDVPALALSLTAIRLFLAAVDRGSPAGAAWAGLVAGVAMQTKYTALLAPGTMLLYALLHKRWPLGALAGLVAGQVFVVWELLTALLYGRSHFLLALGDGGSWSEKFLVFPTLSSVLGGAFPLGALLAFAVLGVGRAWLALGGGGLVLGYALIALFDMRFTTWSGAEAVFHSFSLATGAATAIIVCRLLRHGPRRGHPATFLVLWLALEVLGYLLLTPFPAVRRVFGVMVVLALLIAHCAARTCRAPARRAALWALSAGSALLGLATFVLDWQCVAVHKVAAEEAARLTQGGGTVWYVGHWGFQYYAERAGMRPVVTATGYEHEDGPIELPPPSRFRAGDWLVVPDARLEQQGLRLEKDKLQPVAWLAIGDRLPLTTMPGFYGGRAPVQHHSGTRLEVVIYRVTSDFVPEWGP